MELLNYHLQVLYFEIVSIQSQFYETFQQIELFKRQTKKDFKILVFNNYV